jgi:hypothetical protein
VLAFTSCKNKILKYIGGDTKGKLKTTRGKKMKNSILGMAAIFVAGVAASGAVSAGNANFTLVNSTGYALREVYLSPTHKTDWGDDRLGNDILDNNKSRLFKFSDKSSCVQDLRVVFEDDSSEVTWEGFDLCELTKIKLKYNRKSGMVSADSE